MDKIKKAFKSRTIWTLAIIFVFNGLQAIEPSFSGTANTLVNAALGLMASYFKLNPSQNYQSNR